MDNIQQIKSESLLDYVRKILWQEWKKEWPLYVFKAHDKDNNPSLKVYEDNSRWYCDFSDTYWKWTIIDFQMHYFGMNKADAIGSLCENFWIKWDKKVFKKSPPQKDLIENFSKYKISSENQEVNRFLSSRGITPEIKKEFQENITDVLWEFWLVEWLWLWNKVYKSCIIFPCYDKTENIVGAKLRRIDWEKISTVKSLAIKWFATWLLYKKEDISKDYVLIVEWETDYLILKTLWYKSVIWNLWWVSSNKDSIKELVKWVDIICCMYDNDLPWLKWAIWLNNEIKRPIRRIIYEKIDWLDKYDINDLFNQWHRRDYFDKLLWNAELITDEDRELIKTTPEVKEEKIEKTFLISELNSWYTFEKTTKDNTYDSPISNFKLEVVDILQLEDLEDIIRKLVIKVSCEWKTDIWIFSAADICDISNFKRKIRSLNPNCSFFEMDNKSLEELIRFIQSKKDIPYTIVINKKWFIPKYNCWMMNDWIIFEKKFFPYDDLYVADIWKIRLKLDCNKDFSGLPIYTKDYYDKDIKNKIVSHLNHMFWLVNWSLVLWFLISSLFINSLHRELKPFPILFVSWKKGSWKTTALENAIKILWIENAVWSAESDSVFIDQFRINEISSLPYWSDEFKNWKKSKEKEAFYKTVFDRNWVSKWWVKWKNWDSALIVNKMDVNASLILSWEQTPFDDAVASRVCLIEVPSTREWNLYEEIQKTSDYYPSILKDILTESNFISLTAIYKKQLLLTQTELKNKWVDKRLLNVYSPIIAWYFLYKKTLLWNNINEEDYYKNVLVHINNKREDEKEDIVERFFEKVVFLLEKRSIDASEHISFSERVGKILFNFPILYSLYQESYASEQIPKKSLVQYIKSKYNYTESSMMKTWDWNKRRSHVMSFDTDNMPESLNIFINKNWDEQQI